MFQARDNETLFSSFENCFWLLPNRTDLVNCSLDSHCNFGLPLTRVESKNDCKERIGNGLEEVSSRICQLHRLRENEYNSDIVGANQVGLKTSLNRFDKF